MFDAAFFDINIQYLAPGLMGGAMHAFFVKKPTPWEIVGYIMGGMLAANFFTPLALNGMNFIVPWLLNFPGPVAFLLGMGGFQICSRADKIVGAWNPFERTKHD